MNEFTAGGAVVLAGVCVIVVATKIGEALVDHLQWKLRQSKRGAGWIR